MTHTTHFDGCECFMAEIERLKKENAAMRSTLSEAAKLVAAGSGAIDVLACKEPGRNVINIHASNIQYFQDRAKDISKWDEKLFELGNFENGEFVFNLAQVREANERSDTPAQSKPACCTCDGCCDDDMGCMHKYCAQHQPKPEQRVALEGWVYRGDLEPTPDETNIEKWIKVREVLDE